MAKPTKPTEEFNVVAVQKIVGANGYTKATGEQTVPNELILVNVAYAEASTTEEPREEKLHAGICVWGVE